MKTTKELEREIKEFVFDSKDEIESLVQVNNLIRMSERLKTLNDVLELIDELKEYEEVTKEMDRDGVSPVISKEELKQKIEGE